MFIKSICKKRSCCTVDLCPMENACLSYSTSGLQGRGNKVSKFFFFEGFFVCFGEFCLFVFFFGRTEPNCSELNKRILKTGALDQKLLILNAEQAGV